MTDRDRQELARQFLVDWGQSSGDGHIAMIIDAMNEERERCAQLAEDVAIETASGDGELYIARKIAKAIRAKASAAPGQRAGATEKGQ